MKSLIKSVLFNLHFYIFTTFLVIIMFPVLLLPFGFIRIVAKIWAGILVLGMKIWLGLNVKIIGKYYKNKPYIMIALILVMIRVRRKFNLIIFMKRHF